MNYYIIHEANKTNSFEVSQIWKDMFLLMIVDKQFVAEKKSNVLYLSRIIYWVFNYKIWAQKISYL